MIADYVLHASKFFIIQKFCETYSLSIYTEGQKKRYITFYVISTCSRTVMEIRDSVQKHQPN